jgi:hypothetical protein
MCDVPLKALYNTVAEYRTFLMENGAADKHSISALISRIDTRAKSFEASANVLSKAEQEATIDANMGELYKIHDTLVGAFYKLYLSKEYDHTSIRSIHDRVFGTLSITRPKQRFQYLPTKLFTECVQGVTFFEGEFVDERPIYHRLSSCGTKRESLINKFTLRGVDAQATHTARILALKRCYIERLIYDKIYTNTLHEQDLAHLAELMSVERLFQNYFKGQTIFVNIRYKDVIYPHVIDITIHISDDKRITESYVKNADGSVSCTKLDASHPGSMLRFTKLQTFTKETLWEP